MKTQAWGWLMAGVLAAGLNASYHDGGLQWAHEIADRVEYNSAAVLALASGNADQFLTEARLLAARNETSSCRLATALARVQTRFARTQTDFARFETMSARQEAALARIEANRARVHAQIDRKIDVYQIPAKAFDPVVFSRVAVRAPCLLRVSVPQVDVPEVNVPAISIPRIKVPRINVPRINVPRIDVRQIAIPQIDVPALEIPEVRVEETGSGPL